MTSNVSLPNEDRFDQCYNKGCGMKYREVENKQDSCCFHPGAPVFHDAYKGWSCCSKRSTDFTTFLHMEGCSKGKHNPVKPIELPKEKPVVDKVEVITVNSPQPKWMERPDFNNKTQSLTISVTPSLKNVLSDKKENEVNEEDGKEAITTVKIGESCKNNGCRSCYEGEFSNLEVCRHHPGIPIFHEGMKYWSCCQRKTSDFENFLQQEGCSSGAHTWLKTNLTKASCRYDWHQTPTHTMITIYAKIAQPDTTSVRVNPIRLEAKIAFGESQEFSLAEELGGIILPEESSVTMAATKVEIKLKKAEPQKWNKVFLSNKQDVHGVNDSKIENSNQQETELSVDTIDLSDL